MNSLKNTEESMMKEADGCQGQVSSKRKTFNSSADYFGEINLTKRLTPKRKKIIENFFSKTYAKEEVKQCYGAITPDNQPVLELIKESLNKSTSFNPYSMVTKLDIRDWIVKYPRFFIKAEENGRKEYNLRKEADARSSEQELASGSVAVVEEAQPVNMDVDAQADGYPAYALETIGLSPLSDQDKLALIGLLVKFEPAQGGHFVQPPVSFQLVAWISQVLAAATENAVKGNRVLASNETFRAIFDGTRKTCDILGKYFESLNAMIAANQPVRNEEVEERIHG